MRRVLLTGMSGTGKSTIIGALSARGYPAVDTDDPGWCEPGSDGDLVWCEERIQEWLSQEEGEALFLSGCVSNQGKFYPQLDLVILLSAPAEVILERLATRTNNPYGKRPEEVAEVLGYLETVEPLLRRGADVEIDTRAPVEEVVEEILTLALIPPPAFRAPCGTGPGRRGGGGGRGGS